MSNIVALPGATSALLAKYVAENKVTDSLGSGITTGFAIITYKGRNWGTKFRGEAKPILRDDGDPRASLELVLIDAGENLSKHWYEAGWTDSSSSPPDCWSTNGMTPDPASPKKQSTTCRGCPRNAWGGKINEVTGKPGKECHDFKRLAVVPLENMDNEFFGGPMLLKVPAASLSELATYAAKLKAVGGYSFAVGTKVGFAPNESYPKMTFTWVRHLNDAEISKVLEYRESDLVKRILNEAVEAAQHEMTPEEAKAASEQIPPPDPAVAARLAAAAEKPAQAAQPEPQPAKTPEQPKPAQEPAKAEESAATGVKSVDDELDALLG